MDSVSIPFVDLHAQYLTIKDQIDSAISETIRKSAFVRGEQVEQFEANFASTVSCSHCVSCGNGTDSLYLIMRALGVGPGDEVIVPAHSWISTSETITQAGGTVVFCDTTPGEYTLDPAQLCTKITSKTVGIIPVHLYGQPADMDPILQIADKHRLWVIEDCAQAHLAEYKGRQVGTMGIAGSFSFYPGKNLGAMGDAGAVVTNDGNLANKVAMLARHGGLEKGDHQIEGLNSRMDGIQAAILNVKLPKLKEWTKRRQAIAAMYTDSLSGVAGVSTPSVSQGRSHVWHLYVIQSDFRDALQTHLKVNGVPTVINYPIALPFLPAYRYMRNMKESFPNAFHDQSRILSIPIYPEMNDVQIELVVNNIKSFRA